MEHHKHVASDDNGHCSPMFFEILKDRRDLGDIDVARSDERYVE